MDGAHAAAATRAASRVKLTLVLLQIQDLRELQRDPSPEYYASPLEDNLLEWHFTIRGPPDTEFAGGIYHGRIILPPE